MPGAMKLPFAPFGLLARPLALVAAIGIALPSGAAAAPVSEIVVDAASGATLFSSDAARVRPPASLTKMMTLLLTFDAIAAGRLRPGDSIVMTRRGARQPPSRLGVAAGRSLTVTTAMKTVAVISANDVAMALAERVAGSEAGFVRAMNRRAREIGMTATRFANPTGLAPSGGVTTARDMATLARYIIRRYPDRYRLFSTRSIRWEGRSRPNHNQLLGKVRGVDGVKTGYTVPAGYNLAASSVRKGRRVIVVVLGARTAAARDLLVANLLESGFSSPRGGNRARTVVPARHRR
jgi:D-alanyl-D-alanine carboxypeptidase